MIREKRQTFKIIYFFLDFFLSFLSVIIATILHFYILSPEKKFFFVADTKGFFAPGLWFPPQSFLAIIVTYSVLGLVFSFFQVFVFIALDVYKPKNIIEPHKEILSLIRGIGINLVVVLAFLFFYREHSYSRLVVIYTVIISSILISTGHYVFRKYILNAIEKGKYTKNLLIIGTQKETRKIIDYIKKYKLFGLNLVGILKETKDKPIHPHLSKYILGTIDDIHNILNQYHIHTVIIILRNNPKEIHKLIKICDSEGIECRIVPSVMDLISHKVRIEDMDGLPVLVLRDIPLNNAYHRFMKRAFDIVFSLFVLILTFPLMILIAILVKLSSKGPIFFVQERVGLDRKVFKLIKFRTMYVQDKNTSDTTWGRKNDPRVTPIGRFLRKTSLDELPQFWNVLKGDMSVVGPRPERIHFVKKFKKEYEKYMLRHSVKSGITGWAQVLGYRGDTSIEKRVEADIYYIENWSLLFDIYIILKTIPSLFKNPGE
ncbi:MAG: undecaprenyl-phosphate glucose phosphotransferase [Leptospiraceae bacterium]|nr:undecaprenyl-phosphate glucose phosphotransferase [Leptospiraceae bacterium]MDW7975289.1 undecaprenyl-phosphate glucose phosphotransferase [Leptospiraceae bacterium]